MRNLLLTICYDGKNYHGWQIQQNAVTVQQVFQEALAKALGTAPDLKGCSRTDTGVHAREFCISMKTESGIPCGQLVGALNHYLPMDIAVLRCREVGPDFHARYSCLGKEYIYQIWNAPVRNPFLNGYALHYRYPLDAEMLDRAAACFLGTHDFTSFCTLGAQPQEDASRTVTSARVAREGDMVRFTVAADGFLYNMVRIMAGTLLRVAQGRLAPERVEKVIQAKDRRAAGPTAPPCGLYLNRVFYGEEVMQ